MALAVVVWVMAGLLQARRRDFFLGRVFVRRFLDESAYQRLVADDPLRRDGVPFLAIPLLHFYGARAFMVFTAGFHGGEHAQRTDGLLACIVHVQVFQAPAHLLTRDRFALAEFFLRRAYRFHPQDAGRHAAHVIHGTDARLVGQVALAIGVEFFADVVQHGVVAGRVESHRRVALGGVARRDRVFFGT